MATMTSPLLSIHPSATVGRSDITVTYTVAFDAFDVASNQPYHAHIDLKGDDTNTNDGSTAGPDDQLYFYGAGDIASNGLGVLPQSKTFSVPTTALNEDTGSTPNPDELRAVVTLTPLAPKVVGPIESNLVQLTL